MQPSLSEGFGLTAAEALAAKIPVLVSDQEALKEVIDDGKCGYIFKTGDYVDLSNKLKSIMSQKPNDKMLEDGRKRVDNFFDVKKTAEKYLDNYKAMVSKDLALL